MHQRDETRPYQRREQPPDEEVDVGAHEGAGEVPVIAHEGEDDGAHGDEGQEHVLRPYTAAAHQITMNTP